MSFPRYERYKDSGVEWLGEVPAHWGVERLKRSIDVCKNGIWGEESLGDENDIPCVRVADFDRQKHRIELRAPTIRNVTAKERVGRILEQGDLLLEKSGGGELQPVGCVVLYDDTQPAVCSNFVARMKMAEGMNSSFWCYVHTAAYSIRLTIGAINQTSGIQNLDQDRYFNERAAFPPLAEQSAIATFLDRETAKIGALVAEQQRLIELLKEKRQAVISHAVTKGLNPDAPMKDSGVEWLGEVPAHWSVSPVKYVARIGNGSTPNRDNLDYWTDGDYPWLNSSMVNQDKIAEAEQFVTTLALKECHLPTITPPAVLIGLTGQGRTRGMAATLMFEATINQHVAFIKPNERSLYIDFLRRVFDMAYQHLRTESEGAGSTKGAITCEQISRLEIPLPDINEQFAITAFLDRENSQLDTLTAEANHAITLLQERRSALISAAVRGKIDVRKVCFAEAV